MGEQGKEEDEDEEERDLTPRNLEIMEKPLCFLKLCSSIGIFKINAHFTFANLYCVDYNSLYFVHLN